MFPARLYGSSLQEVQKNATLFVGACGYESRAATLASKMAKVPLKYAISFEDHRNAFSRQANEKTFRKYDFVMNEANAYQANILGELVADALSRAQNERVVMAFDISSMTRSWQGTIIRKLAESSLSSPIETHFVYVPAKFQKPPRDAYNEVVAPLEGFASLAMPNAPMGLVLGLGYDREKGLGLQELLDPKRTVLMIPRVPPKDRFYPYVRSNNSELLEQSSPDWIFEYPLLEPVATFAMLESICQGLQRTFRIVLASLGPKLFGILCLLLAAKNPELSVWQATAGVHAEPRDAIPDISRIVVLKVLWMPNSTKSDDEHL